MVFDDRMPTISEACFKKADWTDFGPNAKEQRSSNKLEARGNKVKIMCFVDADHAGDRLTGLMK